MYVSVLKSILKMPDKWVRPKAARRLTADWTARIRFRLSEGWKNVSLLRVQTGPGVHSASCKISTRTFLGVMAAEHRASLPSSS